LDRKTKVSKEPNNKTVEEMKLSELAFIILQTQKFAKKLDPNVEFWLGEQEIYVERIGQFHIVPDVVFTLSTSKEEAEKKRKTPEKCPVCPDNKRKKQTKNA